MTKPISIPFTHAENMQKCMELLKRKYSNYVPFWIEQNFSKPWEFTIEATARGYVHTIKLDIHNTEIYSIVGSDLKA